ncbi:MAG TPA: radical SAM protein [bacterium]
MARILFLQTIQFEFAGVMSVSAYLKRAGHQVELLFEGEEGRRLFGRAREFKPDLIALSTMTGDHVRCLELATGAKKNLDVPILLGGPHPTFFPEVIEHPAIDIICRGEGEEAAALLCERLDRSQAYDDVRNLWVKSNGGVVRNEIGPGENNLDNYPIPDRELYYKYPYLRQYPAKPFITARGCPYLCTFCFNRDFNRMYHGKMKIMRRNSPGRAVEEMLRVKSRYPLKRIFINDDIFILDKEWLGQFLPLYKREVKLPFFCNVRVNLIDEEKVKMLADAGCALAMFGIESGDEELRRKVLKKNITNEQIYRAAELFHKYGIKIKTTSILGLPDETVEKALKTIKINADIKADFPWCSILQPYPRTELAQMAQEKGLIGPDFSLDDLEASFFSDSVLKQPYIKELTRLQKVFYVAVKMPWTIPIFTRLVKMPLGRLFFFIFGVSNLWRFMRETDIGWFWALRLAIRHRKDI